MPSYVKDILEIDGKTIEIEMVPVKGGTFEMGEVKEKHEVALSSFMLAKYPVTQELYKLVTGHNPSHFKGTKRPVEQVSWYDAIKFCNVLSEKLGFETYYNVDKTQDPNNESDSDDIKWLVTTTKGSNGFRLPTEAEWEYAARGGKNKSTTIYSGSDELDVVGWYDENSHSESKEVGLKAPNALGIYDMSGNVFEWCWDWYGNYDKKNKNNPLGPESGEYRVARGGSWDYYDFCRVAPRLNYSNPDDWGDILGFRLTRALPFSTFT